MPRLDDDQVLALVAERDSWKERALTALTKAEQAVETAKREMFARDVLLLERALVRAVLGCTDSEETLAGLKRLVDESIAALKRAERAEAAPVAKG